MDQNRRYRSTLRRREAGVLLHISSLPGCFTSGDLGGEARNFVDFLANCGFALWQTLPINPPQGGDSPYQSSSVHAGNPCFISLAPLVQKGWLPKQVLRGHNCSKEVKYHWLLNAHEAFRSHASAAEQESFQQFVAHHKSWLDDYTLFEALHQDLTGRGWWEWPQPLREREPIALAEARARLRESTEFIAFQQWLFFTQWDELKRYANERGVKLFGDMPIFVAHDSAEVWANPELFFLDAQGQPTVVAGVPPDYFSATGQRWGNPLYRWEQMAESGFAFWIERLKTQLILFDIIRIDHFRGFEAYWEISASDDTAMNGQWVNALGDELFARLHQHYDPLPLVAEDLGIITAEVSAMRLKYGLPGMKILQFAFSGEATNPYLPYRHELNTVVYTGTHDNDTTLGWYTSLEPKRRQQVEEYLGYPQEPMPWPLIRQALASRARLAMIPMQDLLALDGSHRMNLPGTASGNWHWRFDWSMVEETLAAKLHRCMEIYGRLGQVPSEEV